MRVVCPHAGDVHTDTRAVLDRWPGPVEYFDLADDPEYGYGKLLRQLWADRDGFAIVEHDVVPHLFTLPELALCPEPYCAWPYPWGQAVGVALGCTRFSGLFTRCLPDAVEVALRIPTVFGKPGHFRQLDVWLQGAVLRDLYGWQPHCHLPPVEHRNDEKACEPCAPVRTRVEGRMYLPEGLVAKIAGDVAAGR